MKLWVRVEGEGGKSSFRIGKSDVMHLSKNNIIHTHTRPRVEQAIATQER